MTNCNTRWTIEQDDEIRRRLEAGESFRAIGQSFGVSRSAIAGKSIRLGIKRRAIGMAKPKKPTGKGFQLPKPKKVEDAPPIGKGKPLPVARPTPELVARNPIGLLDLTPAKCHWPIGDPRSRDFRYCGDPVFFCSDGRPLVYCMYHGQIAYTTAAGRAKGLPPLPDEAVQSTA